MTKAEFNAANKSANQRASAAINGDKIANTAIAKYFVPDGARIGAKSGPIPQERGTGASELPGSAIQSNAIAREKIANEAVDSQKKKIAPVG